MFASCRSSYCLGATLGGCLADLIALGALKTAPSLYQLTQVAVPIPRLKECRSVCAHLPMEILEDLNIQPDPNSEQL
jgi:hypothetical protein